MPNLSESPQAKQQLLMQEKAKVQLARRELARRHLLPSVKTFFPSYRENFHHLEIIDALEAVERGELRRLMLFMPPRHGKSELVSVQFPSWYLGKHPDQEIIQTSYSSDLAVDFGRKVRANVGSQEFHNLFPDAQLSETSKASDQFRFLKGGGYIAIGVGGSVTGRGGNCILIDDPHKSAQEAASALLRETIWQWYTGTLYTRQAPRAAIILVMTRWNDDDLGARILNTDEGKEWTVLKFKAKATSDDIINGRVVRKEGEWLWPSRYTEQEYLNFQRTAGPYNWASQYQQDPVSGEAQVFHKEWWEKHETEENVQKLLTLRFLTVDTASSLKQGSNYIGMVDNRVDAQGKWYIRARKYKMDPEQLANYLFMVQEKYHYDVIGIEKTMFLESFEPYLELKQQITGTMLPIFQCEHKQVSKELRIKGLIPYFKQGTIIPIEGQCEDLFPQLLRFPKGSEDDILDALAYQLQVVKPPLGWTKDDFQGSPVEQQKPFDPFSPISEIDI